MDSPQYSPVNFVSSYDDFSFKPYYKWIVLNTEEYEKLGAYTQSFKPYYKWIVLNTNK